MLRNILAMKNITQHCNYYPVTSTIKGTHREKASSSKTPALRKSTNMDFCAVCTLNQLFIRDS